MLIIPAIDLIEGRCVRLERGDFNRIKVYSDNPVEVARRFEESGVKWIHIVDLDAARNFPAGKLKNRSVIRKIARTVGCNVEVGGGVRSRDDVEELLNCGVDRIILGTIIVKKIETVENWLGEYGDVFIAGIDARDGIVRISGWKESGGIGDTELVRRIKDRGIGRVIYTNISRDGLLVGPDVDRTNLIAKISGLRVVLSGGISSESDIKYVFDRGFNIVGVITGKAVYERRISLERMVRLYQRPGDDW